MNHSTRKAILLGTIAALFFTSTYILNRKMALNGGYWMWTAALRYVITLPMLLIIGVFNKKLTGLFAVMKKNIWPWIIWGGIGFGIFYLTLTVAAKNSPAWLIAGTFQLTIVAGLLLSPFIYSDHRKKIPRKALLVSFIVLAGAVLSQLEEFDSSEPGKILFGFLMVTIAAILFPLGNRMILLRSETQKDDLDAFQRVLGMTIGSMPVWIVVCLITYLKSGLPSGDQVLQSGFIAFSSGVVATILFFKATEMVKEKPAALGAVEATQSLEIVIALVAEMILLKTPLPGIAGLSGIIIICAGMILYSKISEKEL